MEDTPRGRCPDADRPVISSASKATGNSLRASLAFFGLPRPSLLYLDDKSPTEKRSDYDQQPKDGDTLERRFEGDGSDDIGGHEDFQAKQKSRAKPSPE